MLGRSLILCNSKKGFLVNLNFLFDIKESYKKLKKSLFLFLFKEVVGGGGGGGVGTEWKTADVIWTYEEKVYAISSQQTERLYFNKLGN